MDVIPPDTIECEKPGIVRNIFYRVGEQHINVRILSLDPFGADNLESRHRRDGGLDLGIGDKSGVAGFHRDLKRIVFLIPVKTDEVEMVVELILPGSDCQFSGLVWIAVVYHLAYLLDRKLFCQRYRAAHTCLVW